jgi:transcriptional regulator with XRE-family HTH domain
VTIIRPKILNRIKKLRWEQNMSVRELAVLSGVSHAHITDIENGKAIPTQITILKISKALNKKTWEVFMLNWEKVEL